MRLMAICHGAFCFGHAAHTVWTWGVLKSSWGVLVLVMGRFTAVLGGAASSLPAIRRHTGNEDVAPPVRLNPARKLFAGCIAFCDFDSCAKLLGDGVAKFCAKLSKQISRNHRPTRPTSPSAKREAQSLALHCSAACKSRSTKHKGLKVS